MFPCLFSFNGKHQLLRHVRNGQQVLSRKKFPRRRVLTTESKDATPQELTQKLEKQLLGGSPLPGSSDFSSALKSSIESLTLSQRIAMSQRLSQIEQSASISSEGIASAGMASAVLPGSVPEPTYEQLRLAALNTAVPFVGFGIMDNALLIIFGDAIDTSFGVMFGISTMCAAAIGNIISDVAGIMLGTVIEDLAAQLRMPTPGLTEAQRQLRSVRLANQTGCGIGMVIGCIIGMFPLLLIDSNKVQSRKREAHLNEIFQDIVTEAGSLVGASRMCLFLRVDQPADNAVPSLAADGKYLYAKYDPSGSQKGKLVPLGRGLVSRAALTGEAWKFDDVRAEPDYDASITTDARTLICIPVLDGNGNVIAVLQAINKVGKGQEDGQDEGDRHLWMVTNENGKNSASSTIKPRRFTQQDVQILKALASHIGVSLQRLYDKDGEEEELRLKDTIKVMKKYGLEGLSSAEGSPFMPETSRHSPLFPEE